MSSSDAPGRDIFWRNFDRRYYAVHSELKPADASIWELPHWITWLGGVLEDAGFKNVRAMQLRAAVPRDDGIDRRLFAEEVAQQPADVYLFSPMTPNLHFAYQMAEVIKTVNPKSTNVFGGVIASPLHVEVACHDDIDYVVRDRGEVALVELLKALANKQGFEQVKNLTYRDRSSQNLNVWSHPELYSRITPDELAFPKVDAFPSDIGELLRYIRINYALGCPFRCSFCTIQTIGQPAQYFSVERVLQEIDAYRGRYGEHHNIYFGDETFTLKTEPTMRICKALSQRPDITFDIQTRLTSLNNGRVIRALKDAGCQWVEVGVETIVQKSMNLHKQKTNLGCLEKQLARLRDEGLPVCSFIINGLPDQSLDEMNRSIDNVCELLDKGLLHASYFFGLVPYPGSQMFADPEHYGLFLRHKDFSRYHEDSVPVYDTRFAKAEEIYEVFLRGVKEIGQAMEAAPYLGKPLTEDVEASLGESLVHV